MTASLEPHLASFLISTARLCAWLFLLSAIFWPLERLFALHSQEFWRRGLAQDLGYFFINGLVPSLLLALPLTLIAVAAHAVMPIRLQAAVAEWPLWVRIAVGLVIGEIGFYWGHRLAHQVPLLWRFHSLHHSARHIYFLVSSRAHPLDNVFIRLCGLIPAVILGVASPLAPTGSLVPVLIVLVATTWGFFIHSNLHWRLGPFEWLVATPAFHHWHHTLGGRRDCNYASMLPWIDKLFGTFHVPRDAWPSGYGIEETLPTTLVGQLIYPFRRSPGTTTAAPATAATSAE